MSLPNCDVWPLHKDDRGYGWKRTSDSNVPAHRWMWEQVRGPIPEGYDLHHTCHNRSCVNVMHLVPMTHAAHMKLHRDERETCGHGHRWAEGNEYIRPDTGVRQCRRCNADRKAKQKRERRQFAEITAEVS